MVQNNFSYIYSVLKYKCFENFNGSVDAALVMGPHKDNNNNVHRDELFSKRLYSNVVFYYKCSIKSLRVTTNNYTVVKP